MYKYALIITCIKRKCQNSKHLVEVIACSHTSLPLKLNDIEAEQCEKRPHTHRMYTGMRKNTLQNDLCLLLAIDNSLTTSQRTACVSLSAAPLSRSACRTSLALSFRINLYIIKFHYDVKLL